MFAHVHATGLAYYAHGGAWVPLARSTDVYTHPNHSGEVTSTADGATVIADNVVDEANLKVSNTPTNGYFLSAQSGDTGGLTWAAASGGGGGADLYVANESSPAAQPSATGGNAIAIGDSAIASGSDAVALGVGSRAAGNNSLSVLINNTYSAYGASGSSAVSVGSYSRSTGSGSYAFGSGAHASGAYSAAIGDGSTASGTNSVALGDSGAMADLATSLGQYALSSTVGKFSYASGRFASVEGSAQQGTYVLRSDTTDATPEALTTNNTSAGTNDQVILPNNSCYGFTGTVIARENSAATNDFAVWEIKGGAVRAANAGTTALGSYNINKISETSGASSWDIALAADTTNGAVKITVTGQASHSIRWVATVNTAEVIY